MDLSAKHLGDADRLLRRQPGRRVHLSMRGFQYQKTYFSVRTKKRTKIWFLANENYHTKSFTITSKSEACSNFVARNGYFGAEGGMFGRALGAKHRGDADLLRRQPGRGVHLLIQERKEISVSGKESSYTIGNKSYYTVGNESHYTVGSY